MHGLIDNGILNYKCFCLNAADGEVFLLFAVCIHMYIYIYIERERQREIERERDRDRCDSKMEPLADAQARPLLAARRIVLHIILVVLSLYVYVYIYIYTYM